MIELGRQIEKRQTGKVVQAISGRALLVFDERSDACDFVTELTTWALTKAPGLDVLARWSSSTTADLPKPLDRLRASCLWCGLVAQGPTPGFSGFRCWLTVGHPRFRQTACIVHQDQLLSWSEFPTFAFAKQGANEQWRSSLRLTLGDELSKSMPKSPQDFEKFFEGVAWVGVVHTDGIGVGKLLIQNSETLDALRTFSGKLEQVGISALKKALSESREGQSARTPAGLRW